jgi:hypothetical protein
MHHIFDELQISIYIYLMQRKINLLIEYLQNLNSLWQRMDQLRNLLKWKASVHPILFSAKMPINFFKSEILKLIRIINTITYYIKYIEYEINKGICRKSETIMSEKDI